MSPALALGVTLLLAGEAVGTPPLHPKLAAETNAFAVDLYRQLADKPGNLFFSPYSISTALAMTYAGAEGDTATAMAKALHFAAPPEAVGESFTKLNRILLGREKNRPYQLALANALWLDRAFEPQADYLARIKNDFTAKVETLDFARNRTGARQTINRWVEEQTQDKIADLLASDPPADTRLILTNAIYFKSAWDSPFAAAATRPEDFVLGDGKKARVPFMQQLQSLPYFSDRDVQVLELPYGRQALSFVVVLPTRPGGLAQLSKGLNEKKLEGWLDRLQSKRVDVRLPKFKFTAEQRLAGVLERLGMGIAFSRNADFTGISRHEGLRITDVVHKALIDVDEKGTEAAAATAAVVAKTEFVRPQEPELFRADHPFLFLIRERTTGCLLFMGRLEDPR